MCPGGTTGKERTCRCRRLKRLAFNPWVGKIPWRGAQQPTPGLFSAKDSRWLKSQHGDVSIAQLDWVMGFPGGTSGKEPACLCRRHQRRRFDPWVRKIPWRRDGNTLQYSRLANTMDKGTWQLQSIVPHRVEHNWSNLAHMHSCIAFYAPSNKFHSLNLSTICKPFLHVVGS